MVDAGYSDELRAELWTELWAALEVELPAAYELRRELHAHPELSGSESGTRDRVLAALGRTGRPVADTGAVVLIGEPGRRSIALRAELDALGITERTGVEWASRNPGAMHACGHDVHLAALVAVARAVARVGADLPPLLVLLQPREESYPSGARDMVGEGVLVEHDCAAVVGAHLHPGLAPGTVACTPGAVNASADEFTIEVTGRPGHAGYPHLTEDPVIALASIVVALQSVVSRNVNPMEPCVLGVSRVRAGEALNAVPAEAVAQGTIRAFAPDTRKFLHDRLAAVAHSSAAAFGCDAEVRIVHGEPVLLNDARLAGQAARILGSRGLDPTAAMSSMGADDFSYFAEQLPSLMLFVGASGETMLHSPEFLPTDADLDRIATALLAGYIAACRTIDDRAGLSLGRVRG